MTHFRSIHWRLLFWQMLLLFAVLISLLALHYHLRQRALTAQTDTTLQKALSQIIPVFTPVTRPAPDHPPVHTPSAHQRIGNRPPPRQGPPPRTTEEDPPPIKAGRQFLENIEQHKMFLIVWNRHGALLHTYGNTPDIQLKDYPRPNATARFFTDHKYRNLIIAHGRGMILLLGYDLKDINADLARTRNMLLAVGITVFLIALAGGWFIVHKALMPIHQISRTAEEIAKGEHSRRIELSNAPEELQSLAQTLNKTFNYLDEIIEKQRQFSADASHELRTPIAVILAQTQAILKRERTIEEYKTAITSCQRAGQRMKALADTLLDLARFDRAGGEQQQIAVDLNELMFYAVADATSISDIHPIDYHPHTAPLAVRVDSERFRQAIMNILINAIRHNPEGCPIHVCLEQNKRTVIITITDEGIGIPADSISHIFDRFYRVDKARSRKQGGAGLGLSIVQTIIHAHGGNITARSTPGQSTAFIIELPLQESLT